ncbi:2263_t:CDS:2 [Dentiscutata erythropus]|uniref:2263_t:CDS:1 n=1 Tax=Dentiscutata erythropus TaxID=1348616 RepID=A0A9N9G2K4_9GLOM|nr:2263_t:CDS:2 [Dentiscutata erythropus]
MKYATYRFKKFICLIIYCSLKVLLIVKVSSEVEISHKEVLVLSVVLIVIEKYELPENLQKQLEKAIKDMKESPGKIDFQEYLQKIEDQLNCFKDFDEKALKINDLNQMINLKFEILSSLTNLKTELFLLVEKMKSNDLESIRPNEINSIVSKIVKYLPDWIDCCSKITNKFNDLSNFINTQYATSRLQLLDIQKRLEFWKKLSDELQLSKELLESFEKRELYVKEYYLNYLVENLTEIGCLINNFCKQIIDEKIVKN